MNDPGLLDLPAPLLDLIDHGLEAMGLPALLRVLLYAIVSGWLSMLLYRRWSNQSELAELSAAARRLRLELSGYDGPFEGLLERTLKLLRLSSRHLRLSFLPALLAGLPLLLLLPWLSNHFSLSWPETGSPMQIRAEGLATDIDNLSWSHPQARWEPATQSWTLPWPDEMGSTELIWNGQTLHRLPGKQPAATVHRRLPLFNALIGNPAGYLPDDAPLAALQLDMPRRDLHGVGPHWLRGWLFCFLSTMFATALLLRWRWKLA